MKTLLSSFIICSLLLAGCSDDFSPKPKGFNRIDLPPHQYKQLEDTHPYSFEYSAHAEVLKDTSYIAEPHWIDIWYPQFRANIQITYKNIKKEKKTLAELINDSYKLKDGHNKKAYAIDEKIVKADNGKVATVFQLEGEVPSQFQFYVTDSTDNYLRAVLYFRTALKNDSLAPVINYMKDDMMHILETLEWKEEKRQ
ncbi:MAG: gliding motility lipoprotein GldD [Cytophagaceae bacterium]|nr:gliding motility lipoprotein GldD [Cytophagaceae bacterium]